MRRDNDKAPNATPTGDDAAPSVGAARAPESRADGPTRVENATASPAQPPPEANADILRLQQRIAELEDQLLRARAEQQNIRKRADNQLAEAVQFANAPLLKCLLPIVDDLERTLAQGNTADAQTILNGVRLMYDNFLKVLGENGVETIDALDQPFDPRRHEAVQQLPADGKKPGTVVAVLQAGFKFEDRVLRPAKVVIAAPPADATPEAVDTDTEAGTVAEER